MIPASYLYKDVYRQTWTDPDIECARARAATRRVDGHHIWAGLHRLFSGVIHPGTSLHPATRLDGGHA